MIDQDKAFSIRLTGQHVHDSFYVSSFADQSRYVGDVALYSWVLSTEINLYPSTAMAMASYVDIAVLFSATEICDAIQVGMYRIACCFTCRFT